MIASADKLFSICSHNLLDLICCTYKDDDDSEVTMDSTVDNNYQGKYIA